MIRKTLCLAVTVPACMLLKIADIKLHLHTDPSRISTLRSFYRATEVRLTFTLDIEVRVEFFTNMVLQVYDHHLANEYSQTYKLHSRGEKAQKPLK